MTQLSESTRTHRFVMPIVAVGVLLSGFDLFIVNVAMPDLARDLGIGPLAELSWILNAYTVAFAALLVPAGRASDRLGAKRAFLTGLSVFVIASALCAASPGLGLLIAARVLQAVGAAVMIPASLGLLLATTPLERRGSAVRLWAGLGGVGAALGPVIGGVLVAIDWRWVFLVNVPVGLVAIVVGWRTLPHVPGHAGPPPRLGGSLLLVATVAAAVSALVNGPEWGWGSTTTIAFAIGSVVGAVLVADSTLRGRDPIVDLAVLRAPAFVSSTVTLLVFHVAFGAMLLSVVLWMQGVWDFSALQAGLAIAPGPLLVPFVAVLAGRLGGSLDVRLLVVAGATVFAVGVASWAALVGADTSYAGTLLPGMILTGVGVGLVVPASMARGTAHLPAHRFSTGSAVLSTARQVGIALGVAVLVAVLGPTPDDAAFATAWWVTAGVSLAAAATTTTRSAR
ncbi:MFS transporter [Aeromicrobium sp. Leaf350]|uniref:MFS transporter n=1 Tax=Aeromicrobium sp. Leaf350 TaxID=2876565 RepID=UPI001E3F95D3|nr:MFS transporter [Aeromicrobium sp. Leaf350]